jgi:Zn-dependent protease with chaperone function
MRRFLVFVFAAASAALSSANAAAEPEIVSVLQRSQQMRLDAMRPADAGGPRASTVRRSFDLLVSRLDSPPPVELRVIRGEIVAETVDGRIVVANEALADLPEGERLFVLAHELGHVLLGHWSQMGLLYRKWIPGAVTPEETDAVAAPMGREASLLSHRQEYEADAFGVRVMRSFGLSDEVAVAAFMDLGMRNDTATHPGTRKRVAALRTTDSVQLQAAVLPGVPH